MRQIRRRTRVAGSAALALRPTSVEDGMRAGELHPGRAQRGSEPGAEAGLLSFSHR